MIEVIRATNLADAAAALGDGALYLGGGTLVMRALNYGTGAITRLVRCEDPSLRQIKSDGERIVIGAGVTMREVIEARETAFLAPVARLVGGPAVRNMATVGGNLFAAHPYGDFTAALIALDGTAMVADGSERPLADLVAARDSFKGLVVSVRVSRPIEGDFRFKKVSRVRPKGVSVLSIAAWLPRPAGRVQRARVAYGAMGPTPMRVRAVEEALEGATLDATGIASVLAAATSGLEPPEDALASSWYRREVAPIHLRRLLLNEPAGRGP